MQNIINLLCLLALTLMGSCIHHQPKTSMPPLTISYDTAKAETMSDNITFTSSLKSVSSVDIEPRVSGYITKKYHSGSCYVKEGELLFEIDPRELLWAQNSARATLEQARATHHEAYHNYMRAKPLAQLNAVSRTELDSYRTTLSAAEAALKEAESQLEDATLNLTYTKIYAPMSGIISNSEVEVGDLVGEGSRFSTLVTLSNNNSLTAELAIPTKIYLESIKEVDGDKELLNSITLTLANGEAFPLKGEYYYTLKDISSSSSTVVIVALFANPRNTLKSGMFARVSASIGSPKERILIPAESITQLQGISSVWIIEPDSSVTQKQVTLAKRFGDLYEVRKGVNAGDKVATSGQLKLHQGAKVIPSQK